jgi:hypothetical protein
MKVAMPLAMMRVEVAVVAIQGFGGLIRLWGLAKLWLWSIVAIANVSGL